MYCRSRADILVPTNWASSVTFKCKLTLCALLVSLLCSFPAGATIPGYTSGLGKGLAAQPSCLDDLHLCKRNRSCKNALKAVKTICPKNRSTGRCGAASADLPNCLINVEILQKGVFHHGHDVPCKCDSSLPWKRARRCTEVYNMVFVNPCYDSSLAAREEARKLAAVTIRTVVAMETEDDFDAVISTTENAAQNSLESMTTSIVHSTTTTAPKKHEVNNDVAKKGPPVSEDDKLELDRLFFENTLARQQAYKNNHKLEEELFPSEEITDVKTEKVVETPDLRIELYENNTEDFQQERVEIFVVPQKSIDPLEKADEEKSTNSISTPAMIGLLTAFATVCLVSIGVVFYARTVRHRRSYQSGKSEKLPASMVLPHKETKNYRWKARTNV